MSQLILSPGHVIFKEGDAGHCAYLIERGRVEISTADRTRVLSILSAGDLFGEIAIIDRVPRTATAIVLEETVLSTIDGEDLAARIAGADPVLAHVMKMLVRRMVQQRGGGIDTGLAASLSEGALQELRVEREIRNALDDGEFEPFFQPIVCLGKEQVHGYEALVRWRKPDGRIIPPGDFLPVAERNARIAAIDLAIMDAACGTLARCPRPPGADPLFVTVNLAPGHFRDHAIVGEIEGALSRHGLSADRLKVELTETALLASTARTGAVLDAIRALGVRICLDDFGTGYSSLGYLHRFPIDTLKIDRSFVLGMAAGDRGRKLVQSVLDMAGALGMQTVVEGIEERETAAELAAMGCQYGQGYLFGRPMERARMLERHLPGTAGLAAAV